MRTASAPAFGTIPLSGEPVRYLHGVRIKQVRNNVCRFGYVTAVKADTQSIPQGIMYVHKLTERRFRYRLTQPLMVYNAYQAFNIPNCHFPYPPFYSFVQTHVHFVHVYILILNVYICQQLIHKHVLAYTKKIEYN